MTVYFYTEAALRAFMALHPALFTEDVFVLAIGLPFAAWVPLRLLADYQAHRHEVTRKERAYRQYMDIKAQMEAESRIPAGGVEVGPQSYEFNVKSNTL